MDDIYILDSIKATMINLAVKRPNNWEAAIPKLKAAYSKIVARMWKECNQ